MQRGKCLILASLLTGCSSANGVEDQQHVQEFSGYALFGDQSPALFYPSTMASDFTVLVYDQDILPHKVRTLLQHDLTCTFHIFRVAALGRRHPERGSRESYIEAASFNLVEQVSQHERDVFIEALDSPAITRESVCSTNALN